MNDIRQANRSLWLIAQDFLSLIANLFGASEEIAERHALTRQAWLQCCRWLRAGEALMRLLLLIEAGAMGRPNVQSRARKTRVRARRIMPFYPEAPDDWRVSFRVMGRADAQRSRARRRARTAPAHLVSSWPLAERAEALLRVFNDPAPFARRLAARLYARPECGLAILAYREDAARLVGKEDFDQLSFRAALALRAVQGFALNTS